MITGLDVCVRKQLVVTCSKDKSVVIWNYKDFKVDTLQTFPEECLALAFHPSGFHIILALEDKVMVMNITSKGLTLVKTLPVKSCAEISFANGGHLFACVAK